MRYLAIRVADAGPQVGGVLVATPVTQVAFGPADLLRSMLLIAPIVLIGAGIVGYWLAGTSLRPVQGIMDELEAISDGRSLHRRLAVPMSADEIARLALGVNRMLARLEVSFGSLHRFTADASHELKTPLMVLRAGVERALVHPATPNEVLQSLDETLAQINQMSEMVENLLTLARADEGRAPLAVEVADLRDILGDVAETAGMLGETSGIAVRSEMPAAPVRLAVDRHRIREMLLNLVTNAIKYTGKGGTVGLRPPGRRAGRGLRRLRLRASASPPATCPTSSSGSGGPTRPARAPAIVRAPAWGWPSPSGSPRRTADPSRCRAGRAGDGLHRAAAEGRRARAGWAGW